MKVGGTKGRRFITQHFGHGADPPRLSQCCVLICVVPSSDRDKYPLRVYVASSRLIAGSEGSLALVV